MKVYKCSVSTPVPAKKSYSTEELFNSAPEGVYNVPSIGSPSTRVVVIGHPPAAWDSPFSNSSRAVIYHGDDLIEGLNKDAWEGTTWERNEGAIVYFEIKE